MQGPTQAFKTRQFYNWASSNGVTDDMLLAALREMEAGLMGEQLGAYLYKKRIPLPRTNKGKSGGARTIIAIKKGDRAFFLHGYTKARIDNIGHSALMKFKLRVKELMGYNVTQLFSLLNDRDLLEVKSVSTNNF